ncbi:hypothetical protein BMS3Abin02_00410 [bacterium BMS3Abin02]|nr:hypothetical protein BMS3Abin02_00410 [bacterium BMS3Abin02]
MANQLGNGLGENQRLDIVGDIVDRVRRVLLESIHASFGETCRRVDVLIADRGRRVDRVDDHVGTVLIDQMGQSGTFERLIDRTQKIGEDALPGIFVFEQIAPRPLGKSLPSKDVTPLADEFGLSPRKQGPEVGDCLLDPLFVERDEHDPVRAHVGCDTVRDLEADQAGPPENHERSVLHALPPPSTRHPKATRPQNPVIRLLGEHLPRSPPSSAKAPSPPPPMLTEPRRGRKRQRHPRRGKEMGYPSPRRAQQVGKSTGQPGGGLGRSPSGDEMSEPVFWISTGFEDLDPVLDRADHFRELFRDLFVGEAENGETL